MSLATRVGKLEAARPPGGGQPRGAFAWVETGAPGSVLVEGMQHLQLDGEDTDSMIDRVIDLHPELELVSVRWR